MLQLLFRVAIASFFVSLVSWVVWNHMSVNGNAHVRLLTLWEWTRLCENCGKHCVFRYKISASYVVFLHCHVPFSVSQNKCPSGTFCSRRRKPRRRGRERSRRAAAAAAATAASAKPRRGAASTLTTKRTKRKRNTRNTNRTNTAETDTQLKPTSPVTRPTRIKRKWVATDGGTDFPLWILYLNFPNNSLFRKKKKLNWFEWREVLTTCFLHVAGSTLRPPVKICREQRVSPAQR